MLKFVSADFIANPKNGIRIFSVVLAVICLLSCGSINKSIDPKYDYDGSSDLFKDTLDKAINRISYDEALMTWGAPVSIVEGDEIFLAAWGAEESGSAIIPIGKNWFGFPIKNGWKLGLSFNKKTRKMVHWQYDKWR